MAKRPVRSQRSLKPTIVCSRCRTAARGTRARTWGILWLRSFPSASACNESASVHNMVAGLRDPDDILPQSPQYNAPTMNPANTAPVLASDSDAPIDSATGIVFLTTAINWTAARLSRQPGVGTARGADSACGSEGLFAARVYAAPDRVSVATGKRRNRSGKEAGVVVRRRKYSGAERRPFAGGGTHPRDTPTSGARGLRDPGTSR